MDLDLFLAQPKWEILKIIAKRPSSPIEIAEITKTTVSYVSQQLKLLEAMGIVKKDKTGAFEKGKPRNVFSIKEDFVYFSVLSDGFAKKKKIVLDVHRNIFLRIWILDDSNFHIPLEKFFLSIDDVLPEISGVFLKLFKSGIDLVIVSDNKSLKQEISLRIKKINEKIGFSFFSKDDFVKQDMSSVYALYDPDKILNNEIDDLKGGSD